MKTFGYFCFQYLAFRRSKSISLGLVCAIALWLVASKAAWAQSSVQRDQQALTILTQTIAAGGGQQLLATIQDITETGTITYNFANPVTGNVTVESRGLHEFRIDADLPNGRRITVVNGEGGSVQEADRRNWPIYRQSAADLGSFTFPYLPLLAAMQEPSISIAYKGLVTRNGASAYDVRLQRVYSKQQDPEGNQGEREARDFYIDSNTFLIASVSDTIHFGGPRDKGISHEVIYSNYKAENGIMVPMTIQDNVQNALGFALTLSQVTVNSGLTDSNFAW